MQIVHFTDPKVGSFDWELPAALADDISKLPIEAQTAIKQELCSHVQADLLMLVATLRLGAHAEVGFEMLRSMGAANTRAMQEFTKQIIQQGK
ncbi:MAG: hypothetical protein V4668_00560 [Patescibacteria group bacterium]